MKKMLARMWVLFILMPLILTAFRMCTFSQEFGNEKDYFCWTGLGTFSGNVTYQIGGQFIFPAAGINEVAPFPLSKLQFPLNVSILTFGNEFTFSKTFEIRGEITKSVTTASGQQQDTDYLYPGQIIQTYSTSDADVQTFTMDLGFRYWVVRQDESTIHTRFGLGCAYLYEHLEWRLSNVNQSNYYDDNGNPYPPNFGYIQSGLIGTYEATTSMPYVEIAGEIEQTDTFSLLVSLGYSPIAQISDEDNHLIRQIVSTTVIVGNAYKIGVQAKYNLTKNWLLMGKWDWLSYDLTGTEADQAYDGSGDTWTEGHEISSSQSILSLSIATKF